MSLVLTHHRFPTHATTLATLDRATNEQGTLQLSEVGSGSFTLPLDDENDIRINDVIRFSIDSAVRHAMIVERIQEHTLDEQEAVAHTRVVDGRGVAAALEWGIIGPANGFGARPKETDRLFNVYSVEFDTSGWDPAYLTGNPGIPAEWPTAGGPYGPYISTVSSTPTTSPNGASWLSDDFTLSDDVEATVFCSADNWADVYIDGQFILRCGGPDQSNSYTRTFTARLLLTAGTHRVTIRFYNKGGDNHGGVRYLLAETSVAGDVSNALHESSTGWKSLETPDPRPGMTPGQAVLIALDALQFRNRLTWLLTDFDEVNDSASQPWPVVGDISTKTSNSLLAFLIELAATYVDWVVDPDTLTLSLYVKDTYAQVGGAAVTLEPAAVTAADGNVIQLDRVKT